MSEASPMATKVLADRTTRRLLGLQIVGGPGSGKRIDTAARRPLERCEHRRPRGDGPRLLAPFATVWEAVQLAARRLADRL
jgi:hypothetical protein